MDELFTLGHNAARGVKCQVEGCKNIPISSRPYLCGTHASEMKQDMMQWEWEKLEVGNNPYDTI